jgi:hypothetical protein
MGKPGETRGHKAIGPDRKWQPVAFLKCNWLFLSPFYPEEFKKKKIFGGEYV